LSNVHSFLSIHSLIFLDLHHANLFLLASPARTTACREHTSAIADAQRSLAAALAREPPTSFTSHTGRITAALDELLAAARSSAARATAATTAAAQRSGRGRAPSADVSWVVGALARLKELLTASDRCRHCVWMGGRGEDCPPGYVGLREGSCYCCCLLLPRVFMFIRTW
jgi:hypothetical protein